MPSVSCSPFFVEGLPECFFQCLVLLKQSLNAHYGGQVLLYSLSSCHRNSLGLITPLPLGDQWFGWSRQEGGKENIETSFLGKMLDHTEANLLMEMPNDLCQWKLQCLPSHYSEQIAEQQPVMQHFSALTYAVQLQWRRPGPRAHPVPLHPPRSLLC